MDDRSTLSHQQSRGECFADVIDALELQMAVERGATGSELASLERRQANYRVVFRRAHPGILRALHPEQLARARKIAPGSTKTGFAPFAPKAPVGYVVIENGAETLLDRVR